MYKIHEVKDYDPLGQDCIPTAQCMVAALFSEEAVNLRVNSLVGQMAVVQFQLLRTLSQ